MNSRIEPQHKSLSAALIYIIGDKKQWHIYFLKVAKVFNICKKIKTISKILNFKFKYN